MSKQAELKTYVSDKELLNEIKSPSVIAIFKTIKAIQKRLNDPDITNLGYSSVYNILGEEFKDFSDKHTTIFTKVVRGENLNTVVSVLFYKDKVERGLITEEELSNILATKFLPEHLKKESDAKIQEMKAKNSETQTQNLSQQI